MMSVFDRSHRFIGQRLNHMAIDNETVSGKMLRVLITNESDSIIESDKVAEAISQMEITSNPSFDKHPEAIIKVSDPAECSVMKKEKPGLVESQYPDLCEKTSDNYLKQKRKSGTRWKGKGAERKALSDPISAIIVQLQSSLLQSNSQGILTSSSVLLDADADQTDLLIRAYFGRPYATSDKDKQWFQLSNEEAFFLFYVLKCIKIVGQSAENAIENNAEQLLIHMSSNQRNFINLFTAYSHLRLKNWVVRPGSQYGVDFVAYRHHPSLVHSEYAVLVLSEDDGEAANGRLQVWSDVHCTLRVCGSVAKTLLVLNVQKHGKKSESVENLDSYTVEERTITRWIPELAKEVKIQEKVT